MLKKLVYILFAVAKICSLNSQPYYFPQFYLPGSCINADFESTSPGTYTAANAVSGWTISSQTVTSCGTPTVWVSGSSEFSIVSTPVFSVPFIGTLPNSPLGGTRVARLNNFTPNNNYTKLAQTVTDTHVIYSSVLFTLYAQAQNPIEMSEYLKQSKMHYIMALKLNPVYKNQKFDSLFAINKRNTSKYDFHM